VPLIDIAHTVELPANLSAAIVAQVSARLERWMQIKHRAQLIVPRLEDLAIERGGRVWWFRGRKVPAEAAVRSLGGLLETLLARAPHRQVPPGLLYVVTRAIDERHLAPVQSVRDFAMAVGRHAPARPLPAIDALVARYVAERSGARAIASDSTISDVRRRRRAGGIPLGTIARDTGIPISLLRELEWGMYDNWLLPHAEPSVIAYAERSGLDARSVLGVLTRDQHQLQPSLPVRVRQLVLPDRGPGLTLESRHRTAPFALAAGLLAMLALATPSDPMHSARLTSDAPASATRAERRTVALETEEAAAPPDEQQVMSRAGADAEWEAASEPVRKRPQARVRPAKDEVFAGGTSADALRVVEASRETRVRPRTPARTAFGRLAHAIAGDGTYRVEPFPRPSDH
jgi:hypothetical protein